jgi:HAD superfamily hydrolase (TIGR01490 family)
LNLTLFDLDGTLIERDSDHAFGEFMVAVGWADGPAWAARNDGFYRQYQTGELILEEYVDFATAVWRARPAAEAEAMRARFVDEVVRPLVTEKALSLVRSHQQAGDLVAIVTATNEFVTRPIAECFGIEHLLAVELEWGADGRATGRLRGVPTFREGKVHRVRAWLAERGLQLGDFERSTFYSDSTNDLPLLEVVTHPVATNPSAALAAIADERRWPLLRLFE